MSRITQIATLSIYKNGDHIVDGREIAEEDEYRVSIAQSLSLFTRQLSVLALRGKLRAGQKIKITIETAD